MAVYDCDASYAQFTMDSVRINDVSWTVSDNVGRQPINVHYCEALSLPT